VCVCVCVCAHPYLWRRRPQVNPVIVRCTTSMCVLCVCVYVCVTGAPFSSVVLDAKNKGYTEPDPREDLSGNSPALHIYKTRTCLLNTHLQNTHMRHWLLVQDAQGAGSLLHCTWLNVCVRVCVYVCDTGMDVARKVAILARTCGLDVTLDTLHVDSLVPSPLAATDVTVDQYLTQLPKVTHNKTNHTASYRTPCLHSAIICWLGILCHALRSFSH
jgi:hypothetical protein